MTQTSERQDWLRPTRENAVLFLALALAGTSLVVGMLFQRREVAFPTGFPREILEMRVEGDKQAEKAPRLLLEPEPRQMTVEFPEIRSVGGIWAGSGGEVTVPGALEGKLACEALQKGVSWGMNVTASGVHPVEPKCKVALPDLTPYVHRPLTVVATLAVTYPESRFPNIADGLASGQKRIGGFENVTKTFRAEIPIYAATPVEIALKRRHDMHLLRSRQGPLILVFGLLCVLSLAIGVVTWRAASRAAVSGTT